MEWMKDLTRQTKEDPRYQSLLKDALALEEAFASFRQGLPEDQRALLDRCLSLWEEMGHLMLLHAYVLGRGNRKYAAAHFPVCGIPWNERRTARKKSFGGILMCGNNNGICGCINNNWWWIVILVLLFCNCGGSWGGNNGCYDGNNGCGCC